MGKEEISGSEYIDGKAGVAEPAAPHSDKCPAALSRSYPCLCRVEGTAPLPVACALEMCFFLAEGGSMYCKHHRDACEAHDKKIQQKTDWCQCAEFMPIPDPKVCAKCHKPIYYMAWSAQEQP